MPRSRPRRSARRSTCRPPLDPPAPYAPGSSRALFQIVELGSSIWKKLVEPPERVQIEAVKQRYREVACILRLLPAEADSAELRVVERQQSPRGRLVDRNDEPIERGLRRSERHLLLQDEMNERGVARVPSP